jgi:glycosyltransferase involved in cell wall biosynthesis
MDDLLREKSEVSLKISIGIVVYNGAEHISRALKSIVGQPYKNIELIVVDGGSTDGTLSVLREYSKYISVLVSETDKGIYDAMNKVCLLANGDWLIFLGCDDVLLDTLNNIANRMSEPDTVYYGDVILRSSGKIYGGKFSKRRLGKTNFCHQAVFYPISVYKKYSYSPDYKFLADYDYNIKLVVNGIPFYYLGEVISVFNDRGRSFEFGDADFARDKIKLIRTSFGNTYALMELLRRRKESLLDKIAVAIGVVMKCILPYSCWKYFQSLWRRIR